MLMVEFRFIVFVLHQKLNWKLYCLRSQNNTRERGQKVSIWKINRVKHFHKSLPRNWTVWHITKYRNQLIELFFNCFWEHTVNYICYWTWYYLAFYFSFVWFNFIILGGMSRKIPIFFSSAITLNKDFAVDLILIYSIIIFQMIRE